ncbi:hypothetical protein D3C75_941020 [compost metagenome]
MDFVIELLQLRQRGDLRHPGFLQQILSNQYGVEFCRVRFVADRDRILLSVQLEGFEGGHVNILTQVGCGARIRSKIGIQPFGYGFHHIITVCVGGKVLSRGQHQVGFAACVFGPRKKLEFNLGIDFTLDHIIEFRLGQLLHPVRLIAIQHNFELGRGQGTAGSAVLTCRIHCCISAPGAWGSAFIIALRTAAYQEDSRQEQT